MPSLPQGLLACRHGSCTDECVRASESAFVLISGITGYTHCSQSSAIQILVSTNYSNYSVSSPTDDTLAPCSLNHHAEKCRHRLQSSVRNDKSKCFHGVTGVRRVREMNARTITSTQRSSSFSWNMTAPWSSFVLVGWLGSRVVSVLDSGAESRRRSGFKSQPRRCGVTVLGKLLTPIVPLFTKQQNW